MAAADAVDEPKEEAGRRFEDFWEAYCDASYPIATRGSLWGKCRDAADELLRDIGLTELSMKRTSVVRILSCLILDAYENDRWNYPHE